VFQGAGHPARQRLPTRSFPDELARGHHSHQITRKFFGALPLDAHSGAHRRAFGDSAKQRPQRIRLTAGDVRKLVGQDADHGFVGSQARQKDCAELDRARLAQNYRGIVPGINVGLNSPDCLDAGGSRIDPRTGESGAIQIVFFGQLDDGAGDQSAGCRQHALCPLQTRDGVRMTYGQRRAGLHFVDRRAAGRIANPFSTSLANSPFDQAPICLSKRGPAGG
jgi:hypothetical protein